MAETGDTVILEGRRYRAAALLKEDRYARSTLLEDERGRRYVLKESVMRLPPGVRVPPLAALLARHEADMFERLEGVRGIPRLTSRPRPDALLREYVEGATVRETARIPDGFFASLEEVLREVHAHGVAYVDLAKEENVLVGDDGRAWLVDFQVSVGRQGPLRALVTRLQREDLYHLSKMRLRRRPDEATEEDRRRVARRSGLARLHRATVKKAYNLLTRYLVTRWSGAGEGRRTDGGRS
jgi:RIO-like serine/threonine protein kinase